jgi:hypothetical protein
LEVALAVVAAISTLLIPGGALAWSLRVRGLWWAAGAPVLSVSLVGVAGVLGGLLNIPFSPVLLVAVTMTAVLISLGVRRWTQPLGEWSADTAWIAAALSVSGAAIALIAFGGTDLSRALSQTYDGVFHLNAVAYVLDTGNASSFDLYKMTQQGDDNEFYPAAWHSLVVLVVQLTGASILTATNAVWIVTSALVWTTGVTVFTLTVLERRVATRTAGVVAALLASCSAAFPYLLLSWGTLYPTGLAYAVLPLGLALAVTIVRRSDASVATSWMLAVLWGVAISFAHPRSIPSFIVLAAPLLLLAGGALITRLWRRRELRRRIVAFVIAGAAVVVAGLASVWWYVYTTFDVANRPISDHLNGGPATARQSIVDSLWQVLAQAPLLAPSETPSFPSVAFAIAALAGLGIAIRHTELRWLVLSFALVAVLYALAAGSNSDLAKLATGAWYKDKYRLLTLLAVVSVPLATLGIGVAASRLAQRRLALRRAALIGGSVFLVLTSWAVLLFGGTRASIDAVFVVREEKAGALLDTAQLELLERLDQYVPESELVAGNPWNGSALGWAVGGREAMFPHFVGEWTADEALIAQHLDSASSDPAVCAAVERTGLRFVLDDREFLWGTPPPEAAFYDGISRAPGAGVLTAVTSEGSSTLYRITACGDDG